MFMVYISNYIYFYKIIHFCHVKFMQLPSRGCFIANSLPGLLLKYTHTYTYM